MWFFRNHRKPFCGVYLTLHFKSNGNGVFQYFPLFLWTCLVLFPMNYLWVCVCENAFVCVCFYNFYKYICVFFYYLEDCLVHWLIFILLFVFLLFFSPSLRHHKSFGTRKIREKKTNNSCSLLYKNIFPKLQLFFNFLKTEIS